MLLSLYANKTVKEVKEAFHQAFPYLKIEFFSIPHQRGEGSALQQRVAPDTLLIDVTGVMREGSIVIDPNTSVAELEEQFQYTYSLPIQVFRNTNGIWIETTETDKLTLAEQNEMGSQAGQRAAHVQTGYYEE
jgi:hypothetical protein